MRWHNWSQSLVGREINPRQSQKRICWLLSHLSLFSESGVMFISSLINKVGKQIFSKKATNGKNPKLITLIARVPCTLIASQHLQTFSPIAHARNDKNYTGVCLFQMERHHWFAPVEPIINPPRTLRFCCAVLNQDKPGVVSQGGAALRGFGNAAVHLDLPGLGWGKRWGSMLSWKVASICKLSQEALLLRPQRFNWQNTFQPWFAGLPVCPFGSWRLSSLSSLDAGKSWESSLLFSGGCVWTLKGRQGFTAPTAPSIYPPLCLS